MKNTLYGIGLDIGVASVGWAVVGLNGTGEPVGLHRLGVRIFDDLGQPDGPGRPGPYRGKGAHCGAESPKLYRLSDGQRRSDRQGAGREAGVHPHGTGVSAGQTDHIYRRSMNMEKLIIAAALTGAGTSKEANPAVPYHAVT